MAPMLGAACPGVGCGVAWVACACFRLKISASRQSGRDDRPVLCINVGLGATVLAV